MTCLPAEPSRSSSVPEIIGWLDSTSFAHARVGLKTVVSPGFPSSPNPDWQEDKPGYRVVFSQGWPGTVVAVTAVAVIVIFLSGTILISVIHGMKRRPPPPQPPASNRRGAGG